MDAKDGAGAREIYDARRADLTWRLAQAESAVHGASLGLIRQQERLAELRAKGFASEARQAQAELEMLDDLRRRRVQERDNVARELAQLTSESRVIDEERRKFVSDNEPPLYRVERTNDDSQEWKVVGPNGVVDVHSSEGAAQRRADELNAEIAEEQEDDA